ncbi:helix-turn-helix domain-containing protein [Streptomyces halobius]|uniref:TetR family transcriptional regulator n=1 Tax=Streptomyces halobius TaxID=2879846 RepID=A0ABY4M0J3_9ACTN|nr:hypothetical protein [Streptomyces halobius]UQA91280.1 hypothetical protein K9S39_04755 [Streptomyces halobius]
MRKHTLTDEAVHEAVAELLAQAAETGKAATVTALADRLGIKRQTLYRDFGNVVADFLTRDAERRTRPLRPPKDDANDRKTIARLRREKDELTRHVHAYEDYIRLLTIENARLASELERVSGVTRLSRFRTSEDQ